MATDGRQTKDGRLSGSCGRVGRHVLVAAGTLSLAVAACRGPDSPVAGESKSFHTGKTEEHPEVLKISAEGGGNCSSTAYAPRYLLTAAHCVVRGRTPLNASAITVSVGSGSITARRIFVHPDYEGTGSKESTHDLALIELRQALPERIDPAGRRQQEPQSGERIELVGFGVKGFYDQRATSIIFNPNLNAEQQAYLGTIERQRADRLLELREEWQRSERTGREPSELLQRMAKGMREAHGVISNGVSSGKPTSQKRHGYNQIASADGSVVRFRSKLEGDEIDTELFRLVQMYIPEDRSESKLESEENAAVSFGDSGGPIFSENGAILGVASVLGFDAEREQATSVYVDIASAKSREFFATADRQGFEVPEVQQEENGGDADGGDDQADPNGDLGVAMSPIEGQAGRHRLYFGVAEGIDRVYFCVVEEPTLCDNEGTSIGTQEADFQAAGRRIFESRIGLRLEGGREFMVNAVAVAEDGTLVSARTVKFQKK